MIRRVSTEHSSHTNTYTIVRGVGLLCAATAVATTVNTVVVVFDAIAVLFSNLSNQLTERNERTLNPLD